jgi:transcriptional regulator with XRE-family HTH domain
MNLVQEVTMADMCGVKEAPRDVKLNRIREARKEEGETRTNKDGNEVGYLSLNQAAKALGLDIRVAREQEKPNADLHLSELYAWAKVLGVPAADLLDEPDADLSRIVMQRATYCKIGKTITTIRERCKDKMVRRMVDYLADLVLAATPEFKNLPGWTFTQKSGKEPLAVTLGHSLRGILDED